MLPLKFLLTHYDAAERLSEIHTLLAEDPDFKWILAERRMLPFVLHSFKICFKNIFKIKFLFSHNFEPSPCKWKVSLHFGSLSWLLIALNSLKMMVSLQQTRRSQPIGLSISKQWISWLTCFFSNLIKAKIFQKISMKYCFIQKLLFPIRLHPCFTHT